MLVLMCHAGPNRYAIDSTSVREVVPFVNFHHVVESPGRHAGVFVYRGAATSLIDLTLLLTGLPAPRRWNSRIILTRLDRADGLSKQVGLLAERVTTAEIDSPAAVTPGDRESAAEALGPILFDAQGLFQLVDISRLLTEEHCTEIQSVLSGRTS